MAARPDYIRVGRVVRAHGVHGNLIVSADSDVAERFAVGAQLLLGDERRSVRVRSSKPYKGKLLVAFDEIRDRDEAEQLRHRDLAIEAGDLGEAPPGEVWVFELVGRSVVTGDGETLGVVSDIETNPAHDLLVVGASDGGEILIPMVAEFVDPLDAHPDKVVVRPPDGLIEPQSADAEQSSAESETTVAAEAAGENDS